MYNLDQRVCIHDEIDSFSLLLSTFLSINSHVSLGGFLNSQLKVIVRATKIYVSIVLLLQSNVLKIRNTTVRKWFVKPSKTFC